MRKGSGHKIVSTPQQNQSTALLLENDESLTLSLREYLEKEGWDVECTSTVPEACNKLTEKIFDLALVDYHGLSVLDEIVRRSPLTQVMVMTDVHDMEVAVEVFKRGAVDLISKPFKLSQLRRSINQITEKRKVPVKGQRNKSKSGSAGTPSNMVGQSPAMQEVFRLIGLVAEKNATVLLSGESGTGKELVARALHDQSRRGTFVAVNCGAIPEHLLEDEMFGHVRGAYTDARQTRIGKFEQANGGTLFLDEIGEMPFSLQVKLLRVLEEREFQKLGSNENIQVDVRIVAATNADLKNKVKKREFRADLFYRLNVVPIHLPPLRQIKEDIPIFAHFLLQTISKDHGLTKREVSTEALKHLMRYDYPGNVRELYNLLELACVLSEDREFLIADDFPPIKNSNGSTPIDTSVAPEIELPQEGIDLNQVVSSVEKNLICQSLNRTGGNKGKAARLLNLKRTTLVEKLRRMNLLEEFTR